MLWSKDALEVHRAVEALARGLRESTTTGESLGQCRADALVDLVLNAAHVDTTVTVMVPVTAGAEPADAGGPHVEPAGSRLEAVVGELVTGVDWDGELARSTGRVDYWGREAWDWLLGPQQRPPTWRPAGSGRTGPTGTSPPRTGQPAPDRAAPGGVEALHPPGEGHESPDRHVPLPAWTGPGPRQRRDQILPGVADVEVPGIGVIPAPVVRELLNTVGARVTMTADGVCTWTSPTGRVLTTTPGITDVTADLTITPGHGPLPG